MICTLSLLFLPVGSSLHGRMEDNKALRCSAAGDAAEKLWGKKQVNK